MKNPNETTRYLISEALTRVTAARDRILAFSGRDYRGEPTSLAAQLLAGAQDLLREAEAMDGDHETALESVYGPND